jgi:ABC-type Na+ efflux pump permease subunit
VPLAFRKSDWSFWISLLFILVLPLLISIYCV